MYLRHLASSGKIAGTVNENPRTTETVQKLFKAGELASAKTRNPRLLLQTTWFYISLYSGKRGESKRDEKKIDASPSRDTFREEYFELNKDEPGTVFSTKNYTSGLDGSEDHADGKLFASHQFLKMPTSDY